MADPIEYAQTANFHEMVLEVETETEGTWARICGMTSRGINRSTSYLDACVHCCSDRAIRQDQSAIAQWKCISSCGR